jgi:hypothetical protein
MPSLQSAFPQIGHGRLVGLYASWWRTRSTAANHPAAPDGNALTGLVVGFRILSFRFQAAGEPGR